MPFQPFGQKKKGTLDDDDADLTDLANKRYAAQRKAGGADPFSQVTNTGTQSFGGPSLDRSPPSFADEADAATARRNTPRPAGPPAPTLNPPATDPRQAAIDAAKQKSRGKLDAAGGVFDPDAGAPPAGADPDFDEFAKERADAQQRYAAEKARALQESQARSNLGGLGLSGATSALQSDVGAQQDLAATHGLADLDKQQRDEKFLRMRQKALTDELEYDEDTDIDHDGTVAGHEVGGVWGDGDPTNNDGPKPAPKPTGDTNGNGVADYKDQGDHVTGDGFNGTSRTPFSGNKHEYKTQNGGVGWWDDYVGSDAQYDYYIAGADGIGVKKGDKFRVPKGSQKASK